MAAQERRVRTRPELTTILRGLFPCLVVLMPQEYQRRVEGKSVAPCLRFLLLEWGEKERQKHLFVVSLTHAFIG